MDNKNYYDIVIIGSGMAGLYSAYHITQTIPNIKIAILEKFKKQWLGGRTSNDLFYGTQIATGAGIGRLDTNPLLINLMKHLEIPFSKMKAIIDYSKTINPVVDIVKTIDKLKIEYKKHEYKELHGKTFKQFFIKVLGAEMYNNFIVSSGYTDYENADIEETLYNYGMDDTVGGWTKLYIPWKKMVYKLYDLIGHDKFKFSMDVQKINKIKEDPCVFEITTKDNTTFYSNKVIIATTISGIRQLVPSQNSIYQQIHGQPFLLLYAKFDKKSSDIMKKYVSNYTIVPGPLQKLIPINPDKGVYMIAYSDNNNAIMLKDHLENNVKNREMYCDLVEKALGINVNEKLHIIAIKDYYWPIGTHYFAPLKKPFRNRDEFLEKAQNPQKGMIVVGEAVSRYQGWVEGALESVKAVLTKQWIREGASPFRTP